MPTHTEAEAPTHANLSRSDHRTLEALFRHPLAHNLEWKDTVALFGALGSVDEKPNHEFAFRIGAETYVLRRPHSKDLTGEEVLDLRHFAKRAGISPNAAIPDAAPQAATAAPNLVVVMDHHEAHIYQIDISGHEGAERAIRPYDPHHFLHHLVHKDESRERGQRSPEDATFYERIAQELSGGGRILLVGHGSGKSNAAHHLIEYLQHHYTEIRQRVVWEVVADLSKATPPQLLDLAAKKLRWRATP